MSHLRFQSIMAAALQRHLVAVVKTPGIPPLPGSNGGKAMEGDRQKDVWTIKRVKEEAPCDELKFLVHYLIIIRICT